MLLEATVSDAHDLDRHWKLADRRRRGDSRRRRHVSKGALVTVASVVRLKLSAFICRDVLTSVDHFVALYERHNAGSTSQRGTEEGLVNLHEPFRGPLAGLV